MALTHAHGLLEDLAADVGHTACNALVDWLGGSSLYVPEAVKDNHPIRHIIGERPFARLVAGWGGEVICLPLDYQRVRTQRKRLICDLLRHEVDLHLIAAITSLTYNQVRNVADELLAAGLLNAPGRGSKVRRVRGRSNSNAADGRGP